MHIIATIGYPTGSFPKDSSRRITCNAISYRGTLCKLIVKNIERERESIQNGILIWFSMENMILKRYFISLKKTMCKYKRQEEE